MGWSADPEGGRVGKGYHRVRRVNRSLMDTWFREIALVDIDTLPTEGGILFTSWHPGGLIDPMLMVAALPGELSFAAKHTLFKVPIMGRLLKAAGGKPVYRAQDEIAGEGDPKGRSAKNSTLIESLGSTVAEGGRVAIFPEGVSHLKPHPVRLRSGAARIILHALKQAEEQGESTPHIVPLGLHYSDQHKFRERVSLQVNQPLPLPPLPGREGAPQPTSEELAEHGEQAHDRAWCTEITVLLGKEMHRCNQAQETWEDRELVWRARRMIHVHRAEQGLAPKGRLPYDKALLGSRRVRAVWQYRSIHNPQHTQDLEKRFRAHHAEMESLGLRAWEISEREKRISATSLIRNMVVWLWSIGWMLGVVSWGAVIGSIPPYLLTRVFTNHLGKTESNKSGIGSLKLLISSVLYPIWWLLISLPIGWLIASPSSPIQGVELPSVVLPILSSIPWLLVSLLVLFWWPLSARLHIKLYARASRSWRTLKLWFQLRSGVIDWDELLKTHDSLAEEMATIGDGLVLPGDPDWTNPESGVDDWQVVKSRTN